jgi:hypothetical protein
MQVAYAYRMMEVSRYYVILLENDDIRAIVSDRAAIISILDKKAKRVFLKKEMKYTDEDIEAAIEEIAADEMLDALEDEVELGLIEDLDPRHD